MTGQQILEAIDEPQFLRLEQPECCPKEHYSLMLRCWDHVPLKRPTFFEIQSNLSQIIPLKVVTVKENSDSSNELLNFKRDEHITVLDSKTFSPFWKGVTNSGKTGLFDPTLCYILDTGNCEIVKKKNKLPYMFGACSQASAALDNKMVTINFYASLRLFN